MRPWKAKELTPLAAGEIWNLRIVVARDPEKIASALEIGEGAAILVRHALAGAHVVEGIAQRHDGARGKAHHDGRQPRQGGGGVVGRQQHAARGIGGPLLQMQVRDHQQALGLVEENAGEVGDELDAGQRQPPDPLIPRSRQTHCPIASCASACAASART